MADSVEQNKVAFKEQYPDAPDDAIHAWATIKYHEDVKKETVGYKNDRKKAYPQLSEQFDKLWHDINNGTLDNTGAFFTALKTVKDDNPKPGE